MKIKTKLCGFTNQETIKIAVENGADFIGFIFHPSSPRNISPQKAGEIASIIPQNIKKVAVIVDADDEKISQIVKYLKPDFLQLHGAETPQRVAQIKSQYQIPIIKAFKINDSSDLLSIKNYEEVANLFLFDAKNPGSGQTFDWKILQNLSTKKEWFLSGGLNIGNVLEAIKATRAPMIDLSSGIEETKGVKSPRLITEFMNKIKEKYE